MPFPSPFTTKEDLRQAYPFGAIAEPLRNVVRVHSSSGTTGTATVVGYTKKDIESWAELAARALSSYGVDEEDIIQVSFGYGLFTGGLGIHYGAEKLGATVVPASAGNTLRQIQIMKDLKITVLACTPSYALYLAEVARENNINWKESSLRIGVFGAEPWSEEMREDIEKKLPIRAFDIYGLSEVIGPGVAFECEEREGLHISEDHFLPEIIDPQTGRVLPRGRRRAGIYYPYQGRNPIVRYRTGDISSLNYEPCSCGRTLVRMKRVFSRTDDMLIIRGVNVYPSQIESIVLSFDGVEPYYQIVLTRENFLDQIEIQVEVTPQFFSDQIKVLEGLKKQIEEKLKTELNLSCEVKLLEPKSIARSEGKSKGL